MWVPLSDAGSSLLVLVLAGGWFDAGVGVGGVKISVSLGTLEDRWRWDLIHDLCTCGNIVRWRFKVLGLGVPTSRGLQVQRPRNARD